MNVRQTRRTAGRWIVRAVVAAALSTALIASVGPALAATPDVIVAQQAADDQTNVGGGVTVKVSRLEAADTVAFTVVLDTHSVNLDTYDLVQLAVLRTPTGEEIAPLAWDAPAGGHHREGTLSFPATTADGSPLLQPDGGPLLLVIRDIAGVAERTFSWMA
jgi:hypothetical protein